MKILLCHNFYTSKTPSGENNVFDLESTLLKNNGNIIKSYKKESDNIGNSLIDLAKVAISCTWNFETIKHLEDNKYRNIDLLHVHNSFPLISPSVFHSLKHIPKVLTLHNYRLFCPSAIPMRNGNVCTLCIDKKTTLPSIKYKCYRNSTLATIPLAASVSFHRLIGTWDKHVDAFICLSEFQRDLMIKAGLPAHKVHVKPNFYPGNPTVIPWTLRKPYVVFAGRLSKEKGVISLISAWKMWGAQAPELRLVGDGELRSELEALAKDLPIKFLGQVSSDVAEAEIANARLQILPSEWFEGFPMVVREAFAFGTPSAVSNIGPLPSIVEQGVSGLVFEPNNPDSLLQVVKTAWETPGLLETLGTGARKEFEEKYNEDANYAILMDIYQKAIEVSKSRK